jgi:hypothetical protein
MVAPSSARLGRLATDAFVWRAVFYINVPIGAIALIWPGPTGPRAD